MNKYVKLSIYLLCLLVTIGSASASWIFDFMEGQGGLYYSYDNNLVSTDVGDSTFTCSITGGSPAFSNTTKGIFVNSSEPYHYGRNLWDGSTDRCTISATNELDLVPGDDFYISYWINWTASSSDDCVFSGVGGGNEIFSSCIHFGGGTNVPMFWFRSTSGGNEKMFQGNVTINDADWHHVVFAYNGTGDNSVKIWQDNVLIRSEVDATGWTMALPTVYMATDITGAGRFLAGELDEFHFQKIEIGAAEVELLFNVSFYSTEAPPSSSIDETTWDVTSAYTNQTVWRLNQNFTVFTRSNTPSTLLNITEAGNISCGIYDLNFTAMTNNNSETKAATVSTVAHTCTIPSSEALAEGVQCMYFSLQANQESTSTSGCMNISLDWKFEGTTNISSARVANASLVLIDWVRNLTVDSTSSNDTGHWSLFASVRSTYSVVAELLSNATVQGVVVGDFTI